MKNILLVFALAASSTVLAQPTNPSPSLNIVGEGQIAATPDKALISVSILAEEDSDYKKAQQEVNVVANKILSTLKELKIEEKNIRTDVIRLNKIFDYNLKVYKYTATQGFVIELLNLKQYDVLMQRLLEDGVNQIDWVRLEVSNREKLEDEARKLAVKNAKHKADLYAKAMGVELVGIKRMQEEEIYSNTGMANFGMMAQKEAAYDSADNAAIATGTMFIKARVQMEYEIKNK